MIPGERTFNFRWNRYVIGQNWIIFDDQAAIYKSVLSIKLA